MKPKASPETESRALARESKALRAELSETQARLAEAEETLRAIRQGEVDALVVSGPNGDQVFTLQGAETPYRWLVEEMNEGALLVSNEGTILFANLRFARLTGVKLEGILGASWKTFFNPSPSFALHTLTPEAAKTGIKGECELQHAGGARRPVELSLVWMQRQGLEGYSVIVTDLTERKTAEEALRASNARLREMVAELEHFSYSISHDMRAPLRAMKSFAVILEQDCGTCERAQSRELLGRISHAASRLDHLIEGSLHYARAVKVDMTLESVPLASFFRSLLTMYPNLSADRADIRIEGDLPIVRGNESALTQVFSNLLGNAIKFVAPGTRPRVRIWAEPAPVSLAPVGPSKSAGSHLPAPAIVRVWVEDNGIGIPPIAQGRIFELFQRATKDYEGTGIGLAVVRKMVERMGGRVGVESELAKGSRFWVELQAAS